MSQQIPDFIQEQMNKKAERDKRIAEGPLCPILSSTANEEQLCLKERCGFWNKEKQQCGVANR